MTSWNYRLPNQMYDLFSKVSAKTRSQIRKRVFRDSKKMGLTYNKNGHNSVIPLMLRPRLMSLSQRTYVWNTTQILNEAFSKIPQIYFDHPEVWDILPFGDGEERWLGDILPSLNGKHLENFTRWDGNADFASPAWNNGYQYFECNAVGVGGFWYCPIAEEITMREIYPELKKIDPTLKLLQNDDARLLLMKLLRRRVKQGGLISGHLAIAVDIGENSLENYIEFQKLEEYLKQQGLPTLICNPRDLHMKNGEMYAREKKVSLVYRDSTLSEYVAMEKAGIDMSALKLAFKQNRMISSLSGEFDHKSVFELFSSARFTKYFSVRERAVFHKHILWTRLVRDGYTEGRDGKNIDILPYIRLHKDELVLKPNRSFGGEGVEIGKCTTARAWGKELEKGLKISGSMVVQKEAYLPSKYFPGATAKGTLLNNVSNYLGLRPFVARTCYLSEHPKKRKQDEQYYTVAGIISTRDGMTVLGRVAKKRVVNVTQDGGLTAVLLSQNI